MSENSEKCINWDELQSLNNADKKQWVIEKIKYIVYVGSPSRREDLLATTFEDWYYKIQNIKN